jgi:hypothetical protein
MLTKTDLSKLEEKFVTKGDLKSEAKSLKDVIVEFKDAILHEIQGLREDVAIVTGYKDQIEDQETRIETLEKKLPVSP